MIIKNVNPTKILEEFLDNGIKWLSATNNMEYDVNGIPVRNTATLTVTLPENVDADLIQQIIDNHDPTPLPPLPTKEETLERELANTNAMILELTELIVGGM